MKTMSVDQKAALTNLISPDYIVALAKAVRAFDDLPRTSAERESAAKILEHFTRLEQEFTGDETAGFFFTKTRMAVNWLARGEKESEQRLAATTTEIDRDLKRKLQWFIHNHVSAKWTMNVLRPFLKYSGLSVLGFAMIPALFGFSEFQDLLGDFAINKPATSMFSAAAFVLIGFFFSGSQRYMRILRFYREHRRERQAAIDEINARRESDYEIALEMWASACQTLLPNEPHFPKTKVLLGMKRRIL